MTRLFRIAAIAIVTGWCARGESVVVPNDRATQAGNAFIFDGFDRPAYFQNVYGAGNFSGPVIINGISFRVDENRNGTSFDVVIPRVTIRVSTFSGTFASFNQFSYDANKGPDDITAFDASVHWKTTDLPGSGPNPFDLKIQFSEPFVYDGSKGALLMNYESFGPFSGGIIVDAHGHGDATVGWFGAKSLGNLVTEFDFTSIPEPGIGALIVFFAPAIMFYRKSDEHL